MEDALQSMKTSVDDLMKNGRNWYRYGAVRAPRLFALTTSATSDEVKAALTDIAGNHPRQEGLDACISGHLCLVEYVMGGTVMVGWSGQGYVLTYVGQLSPTPDVYACTITVSATDADGETTYGVVRDGTRIKVTAYGNVTEEQDGIVTADMYSRMLSNQVVNMGDVPDEEGLIEKIKILCDLNTPRIVVYERGKGDGATFYQGWLMLYNNVNGLKKHVVCFEASGNDDTYKNFCVYNFNHKDRDDWGYVNKFELGDGAVAQAALEAANSAKQTADTANSTAVAAKTAADGAAADAATAKSDAATAKSTAETASQTAATAKSTADTAKSTADTANSTAEEAKASAEGLAGEVTELGQQLGKVAADATDASDGLHQFMSQGILTQAPFPKSTAAASGSFAAVGGDAALKDGEIIPWVGWLTLVLCYTTTDSAAKVKLTGYAGQTLGKCELIGETAVAASEEPRVVRITGEHDYNPRRIGASDACMDGSSYYVNVEVKNPNAGFTLLWAVVYESDPYGNPRRRGGSERERLCACQGVQIQNTFENDANTRTPVVYNERTGWFEMNGLTDISWKDMRAIAEIGACPDTISAQTKNTSTYYNGIRTNQFTRGFSSQSVLNNSHFTDIEVLHLNNTIALPQSGWMSLDCEVIAIIGYFNLGYAIPFDQGNAFSVQTTLESVKLRSLKQSFTLNIKMLSWDSINYLITNAANTKAITITVHADVYAKLTGGTVDNWGSLDALASEKGVKLVSFGESGYPFLTRVLWHGYKRLENKINEATSGDTIYIHPNDRRKISAAQKDDWAALVTAGAEKQISFALPADSE